MKDLILAREVDGTIWVGNGVQRRHIEDTGELEGLQYWISQKGGDSTLHDGWTDIRVLGQDVNKVSSIPVNIDYEKFVTDVVDRLSEKLHTLRFDSVQSN